MRGPRHGLRMGVCAAYVHDAHRRPRPPRRCGSLPIVILAAGFLLALPLAAATLPDPVWIPGVYDDGDDEDLIMLAYLSADIRSAANADMAPACHRLPPPSDETRPNRLARSGLRTRSPPKGEVALPLASAIARTLASRA